MSGFVECANCAAKSGSPTLCPSCLANRARIAGLEKRLAGERERAERTKRQAEALATGLHAILRTMRTKEEDK